MNLKSIFNKLKNPVVINQNTLFPREIITMPNLWNKKVKAQYLDQRFNGQEKAIRRANRSMNIQLALFFIFVAGLFILNWHATR